MADLIFFLAVFFIVFSQRGCAEYDGDPDSIVRDGFLAPVFCLNFKDDAVANEISLASWTRLLLDAGFEDLGSNLVYAYW